MRSEYVYIAWAVVVVWFTWQVNQPKSDLAWLNPPELDTPFDRNADGQFVNDKGEVIQPMGIIGDDDRVTFAQFFPVDYPWSSLSKADYRASVIMDCENTNSSASIVYQNDIIVFAAHQVLDDDGNREKDLESCAVLVGGENGDWYEVDWSTLKTGEFKVPETMRSDFVWKITEQDWAVARLKRPVDDVKPYALPPQQGATALPGLSLANVTSSTDNWPDENYRGMLAQTCNYAGGVNKAPIDTVSRYNCDTGGGASGSGLLAHDGGGGTYIFGTITDMNRFNSIKRCEKVGEKTCFTAGRRIDATLARTIQEMAQPNVM